MYQRVQFPNDAVVLYSVRTPEVRAFFTPLSTRKSVNLVRDKAKLSASKCCSAAALVTRKRKYFSDFSYSVRDKAATPPKASLCFHKNTRFLYAQKIATGAVLKLISALMAVAHVLFSSRKSLSVCVMLPECPLGKLKYD